MKTVRANLPANFQNCSLSISQGLIKQFADLAGDYNPIHMDAVFAKKSSLGKIIAHGSLSMGLIWNSAEKSLLGKWLKGASLEVRFRLPAYLGDDIISGGVLRSDCQSYDVWVNNQHGDHVIKGIFYIRSDVLGEN